MTTDLPAVFPAVFTAVFTDATLPPTGLSP
jgi:hypothetical protein